jgi:hypothetical protein
VPGISENGKQERRRQEPRTEVVAGGADQLDEPPGRSGAQTIGDESEVEARA